MLKKFLICGVVLLAPMTVGSLAMADEAGPVLAAPPAADSSLTPGEVLRVDQGVRSPNGKYTLVQQPDGNLVLYNPQRKGIYSTNTARHPGASAAMQPDGNFVVYSTAQKPIFHTNTARRPGARLDVQTMATS